MSLWFFGTPDSGSKRPLYSVSGPVVVTPLAVIIAVIICLPLISWIRELLR
jgi:hypothetical protein